MKKQLLLQEIQPSSKNHNPLSNLELQLNSKSLIFKYNLFIRCYNIDCNRINDISLDFIPQSKIFNSFTFILSNKQISVLFAFSLLIPFLNLLILAYLFTVIYAYFKRLKVYENNQKKVENPFENMKFDSQKCQQLRKNFYFMTINFKNLRPQFNFKQNIELTQSQGKSGSKSVSMIYNEEFASYYYDLPKIEVKLYFLLIAGVLLSFGSILPFVLFI